MATKIYLDINKSCIFDLDGIVDTVPTGSLIMRKDGLRVRFNLASNGQFYNDFLISDIEDENGDAYGTYNAFVTAISGFFLQAPDLWGFETLNHANATFQVLADLSNDIETDAESETKYPAVKPIVDALTLKSDASDLSNDIITDAASITKYPSVKVVVDALSDKANTADLTITALTTLGSDAIGDMYCRNASGEFDRIEAPVVASALKHTGVAGSLPYWSADPS